MSLSCASPAVIVLLLHARTRHQASVSGTCRRHFRGCSDVLEVSTCNTGIQPSLAPVQDVLWRPTTAAAALDYITEQAPGLLQRCVADLLLDAACVMRCGADKFLQHQLSTPGWWQHPGSTLCIHRAVERVTARTLALHLRCSLLSLMKLL